MKLRGRSCSLALCLLFARISAEAVEQADSPGEDALPVSVTATPAVVWTGKAVDLSGESVGGQGLGDVTLTIQPPAAPAKPPAAATLHTALDIAGRYSIQFSDTKTVGIYRVKATAPDGHGVAETSFRVTDAATSSSDVDGATRIALTDEVEIVAALAAGLDRLPPSPAKDEAVRKLGELSRKTTQMQQMTPQVATQIQVTIEVGELIPDEKIRRRRAELINSIQTLKASHPDARVMLGRLQPHRTGCDDLDVIVEGFKFASFLFNLIGGPADIAENYGSDILGYVAGKAAQAGGETASFGASETAKNAPALIEALREIPGKLKFRKVLPTYKALGSDCGGIASDLGAFVAGKTMSAYCEQFTGPMTAHMKAQFFHEGDKWWEYEFDLTGTVTVHYPKSASGETIAVKGRMEGNAKNFKVWENELHVLYPKLMSSAVIKKVVIPVSAQALGGLQDIDGLYATARDMEGSVVGAHLPFAFFFDVTGVVTKDRIELVVGAARTDMDASATVVALAVSPLSLYIHPFVYKLPYKNAHFVFERTANTYEIPLSTVGKVIRGKHHFENQRGTDAAKGTYSVDIEMCNPACGG